MLAGVIGGIAEVIGVEAKLLRIVFVILLMFTGFFPMGLIYLLLVYIMPNEQRLS
jgi:phage shock protein PspC (stress-responsive transcriptional regulator)